MAQPMQKTLSLKVQRVIAAPIGRVFAAWTEQKQLEHWMCRDEQEHVNKFVVCDVRPGGSFLLDIDTPQGDRYRQHADFIEVRPSERIVFKWYWEKTMTNGKPSDTQSGETLVTVQFRPVGSSTEVTITHEGFIDRGEYEGTQVGWNGCLDMLEKALRVGA